MDTQKYHKRMFENIFDLIKGGKFEEEARKEMKKFLWNKEIEWDGDNGTISIGRGFKIKLIK